MDRRAMAKAVEGLDPDQEKEVGNRVDRTWLMADVARHVFGGDRNDVSDERRRLIRAQANLAELEEEELRGELVRVQAVEKRWGTIATNVRAKLLALPSRLAGEIASAEDRSVIEEKSRAIVYEALTEIAEHG
jgi:phage terminase Nu1 subunit (DNA packaging protein)